MAFNGISAVSLNPNDANFDVSFGTSGDFDRAITEFRRRVDDGATPYQAAFFQIYRAISSDLRRASPDTNYVVAFLTDGTPTDYCRDANQAVCPGRLNEDKIDQDFGEIMKLAKNRIQVTTVYYGEPNADAQNRLQRLAKLGSGQFVNANNSEKIDLQDVIKVPKKVCK